jgi:DUF4097 and DUF4098 domain-containing protein YvlB
MKMQEINENYRSDVRLVSEELDRINAEFEIFDSNLSLVAVETLKAYQRILTNNLNVVNEYSHAILSADDNDPNVVFHFFEEYTFIVSMISQVNFEILERFNK